MDNKLTIRKPGQSLAFIDKLGDNPGYVIKAFSNNDVAYKRAERAKILKGLVPEVVSVVNNLLIYKTAEGNLATTHLTDINHFLDWCQEKLWNKSDIESCSTSSMVELCNKFYKEKMLSRIHTFKRFNTPYWSYINCINGRSLPSLDNQMEFIDWHFLSGGIPINKFHGDLHLANVLMRKTPRAYKGSEVISWNIDYTLLDWREDFGGSIECGDVYYDLAKLNHGLILSYDTIANNRFEVSANSTSIEYSYYTSNRDIRLQRDFRNWVGEEGHSLRKVDLLTALIFMNIAPLHESPRDLLFFALGRDLLHDYFRG